MRDTNGMDADVMAPFPARGPEDFVVVGVRFVLFIVTDVTGRRIRNPRLE